MQRIANISRYKNVLPYASEIFGVYQPMLGWRSLRSAERFARGVVRDSLQLSRKADRITAYPFTALKIPPQAAYGGVTYNLIRERLPSESKIKPSDWSKIIADVGSLPLGVVLHMENKEWTLSSAEIALTDWLYQEQKLFNYLRKLVEKKAYTELQEIFFPQNNDLARIAKTFSSQDPIDLIDPFEDLDRVSVSPLGIVHLFRQYFFELDTFLGSPVSHVWLSPGGAVELIEVSTRKSITERTSESMFETIHKTEKSISQEEEISEAVKKDNQSNTSFGANASVHHGWIGGSASAAASYSMNQTQQSGREIAHRHMRTQSEKLSEEIRTRYQTTFRTVTEVTDLSSKRYLLNNTTPKLINYELRRKMRQIAVQVQDIGTYLCWQTYVDDPGRQLGVSRLVHIAKDPEIGTIPAPEAIPAPVPTVTEHSINIPFIRERGPEGEIDKAYRQGVEEDPNTGEAHGGGERIKWRFHRTAACDKPGYEFERIEFDTTGQDVEVSVASINARQPGSVEFTIRLDYVNFRGISPMTINAKVTWKPSKTLLADVVDENKNKLAQYSELSKREFEKAFVEAARERIKLASNIEPRSARDLREEERIVVYRMLIQAMLTKDIPMPDPRTRHTVSELLNTIFDVEKMLYFVAPEWWRPRLHQSQQDFGGSTDQRIEELQNQLEEIRDEIEENGSSVEAVEQEISRLQSRMEAIVIEINRLMLLPVLQQKFDVEIIAKLNELRDEHVSLQERLNTANAQKKRLVELKVVETRLEEELAEAQGDVVDPEYTTGWGGINEGRVDNYYITEESAPARLGSSLGWLLQLDGDNRRNAFLNAPWVKAVMPIRPGKERAAINWLKRLHVEGTEGLNDQYMASSNELDAIRNHKRENLGVGDEEAQTQVSVSRTRLFGFDFGSILKRWLGESQEDRRDKREAIDGEEVVTVQDAIYYICDMVKAKHEKSTEVGRFPESDEIHDDDKVSSLPIDKVYEHGFYPLEGGFKLRPEGEFEIFDQWVEILPTDQVVPVEVQYDPMHGRQIPTVSQSVCNNNLPPDREDLPSHGDDIHLPAENAHDPEIGDHVVP